MKKTIKFLFVLWVCSNTLSYAQQDPQFSEYQFNQMVINPAYAGSRDALSAVIVVRQQWSGFSGVPRTQSFSLHGPLKQKRIGLGLSGYADQIGPQKTTGLYGNFAYLLPINNKLRISFGLRAGMLNYNMDWNKITYKDANENQAAINPPKSKTILDLDAGLYLKSNTFYCGLSATHLSGPRIYDENYNITINNNPQNYNLQYRLNTHLFFIISKGFKANENLVINPTIMAKSVKGITNIDINLNFLLKQRIWLGAYYRTRSSVGALAQVFVTERLRIGYTYDMGLGKTLRNLGGSHEIMLGFDFNTYKSKMLSPRFL